MKLLGRKRSRPITALASSIVALLAITGCSQAADSAPETASESSTPTTGGTITAALSGDPQNLDSGLNSGALTIAVGQNIFEGLFALDANFTPQPMLAESYEMSDDGLQYTITLRDDVPFHNGDIMTTSDVIASLNRWMEVSSTGQQVGETLEGITALDERTIEISLSSPRYSLIGDLAWYVQAAIILPASIAEAAGSEPLSSEQIVGTGPYKLDQYTPGQGVTLSRFDEYAALDEESGGYGGAKHAYADTIDYVFVADASQRLNGLKTGQWDWVQNISNDDIESASSDASLTVVPGATGYVNTLLFNHNSSSIFSDLTARQALNALLDRTAIATASFGPEWIWDPLSPAMVTPTNESMYSDEGEDVFNDYDPDEAAELFAEAGVDEDSTVRILATQTYPQFYQWAVLVQAALEEIGIPAEIQIFDYATMVEKLTNEPESWDLSMTYFSGSVISPGQILWLGSTWPGEYSNDDMSALLDQYQASTDSDEAHAVIDEIQALVWEDLPVAQLGAVQSVGVYSAALQLPDAWTQVLWNAWLTE